MKTSYPDYYKEFHCIADKCEATCCAGWQIVVDEEALKRYKKVTGEFAGRIKEGVDFKEGVFYQKAGKRCAFLNDSNLCDMYTALGEEAFCDTCARYPRHIEEFENVREYTLSVSCPEAARILLSKKEKAAFYTVETKSEEEEFDDFDPLLYEKLAEARTELLCLIQNRDIPYEARALAVWKFAEEFQDKMDAGELFSGEGLYDRLQGKLPEEWELPETSYEIAKALFALLHQLEFLAEDWEAYLTETEAVLYGESKHTGERNATGKGAEEKGEEPVKECVEKNEEPAAESEEKNEELAVESEEKGEELAAESEEKGKKPAAECEEKGQKLAEGYEENKKWFAAWKKQNLPDWDIMREQLLVYFVYTYFCGSVYDEYVASKVKMAVCSVFYIEEMARACFLKNNGHMEMTELVRMVYRYSRELEHSDENLILMDKMMEEI